MIGRTKFYFTVVAFAYMLISMVWALVVRIQAAIWRTSPEAPIQIEFGALLGSLFTLGLMIHFLFRQRGVK